MRRLRFSSIGTKINLALLFFFLMLGGLTTVLILYGFNRTQDNASTSSREGLEEFGSRTLGSFARLIAGEVGIYFSKASQSAELGAKYLIDAKEEGPSSWDAAVLVSNQGGALYDPTEGREADFWIPNFLSTSEQARRHLQEASHLAPLMPAMLQSVPDATAVYFAGADGEFMYYPPIGIHDYLDPDTRLWSDDYAAALPENNPERQTIWIAPYDDLAKQGKLVSVATPVYIEDEFLGVVGFDLSLDSFVAIVDSINPTEHGFAFYIDSAGELLPSLHSKSVEVSTDEAENETLSQAIASMNANETGQIGTRIDGVDVYVAFAPVEGIGGSLAIVGTVEDVLDEAQASAVTAAIEDEGGRTLRLILLAMCVLFAGGLMSATYLNRRVLGRPIEAIVAGTRAVAEGNFDTRIEMKGNDEIATLAGSFNQMTADLRDRRDALQQESAEREAAQQELAALFAAMTDAVIVMDTNGYYVSVPKTITPALRLAPADMAGKYLEDMMPAEQAIAFRSEIRRAVELRQTQTIEYPMDLAGETFWFSASMSPLSEDTVVIVARDITDRVLARQELERQVEERTRELRLLLDVSQNVASTLDMRDLADTLLRQLWSVIGFDGAALMLLQDGGARVFESPIGNKDAPGNVIDRLTVAPPGGTGSMAIERGAPVAVADTQEDPELAAWVAQIPGRATAGRSWLSAPLIAQGRVMGVLNFWSETPGTFGEQHAELAMAVANQTAIAIENARLYQEASSMAAVGERQRLARELHDSVSQALYGIALGARTARTLLDTDPSRATEPVDYVLQLADAGLAEMRALIFELRPESLEAEGLVAALEKQIAATRARYGLEVEANLGEEPSLSLGEKEVFYRVAQESLHNIVKHAHATRIHVSLTATDGQVRLEVRDDGVGFDTSQSYPGHMGLVSFTERAASIGARLDVKSAPGAGTAVRLSLG